MKKLSIIFLVALCFNSYGQQIQQSSLYMYNALYYNPAYAGTRNTLSASLLAREQWVGFRGAPSSQYFSIHSPLKRKEIALGGHFNYDRIGSRSKLTAYVNAAGSVRVNKSGDRVSVGLSVGIDNYNNNFQSLYAVDANDYIATSAINLLKPNVGAGIYYYGQKHYVGLSIPNIIEWKDPNFANLIKRHLYFTAGYVFELNSVLDLKPATLVRYVPGAPISIDLNLSFLLYNKFWIGVMGRSGEGLGVNAAFIINDKFTLGYAYDYPLNKLRTYQHGSHEVMLQFDFNSYKGSNKIYSPRYF